jgi:pyruvate/2-oxoglutarate dehydrogenase complex dihydrolipoamide acyltransferase (E2) component
VSTSPLRRDRTHTDIPLTNVRKVIASRLSASKQTIPHAYSTTTLRMDAILKLRAALKDAGRESIPSVNDFIIRASALALRTVPAVNSIYASKGADVATPSSSVDISVAVATPTGLITPIVKNADTKRLDSIGAEVKELANRAKANKLKPEEFQGGSFTYVGHKKPQRADSGQFASRAFIFSAEIGGLLMRHGNVRCCLWIAV